jgi:aspartyl-tRNA(Asn)/glutamyl-tRNA(Gln) amidotransferase subunit A
MDSRPQNVLTGLKDGVRGLRLAFAETVFWDQADPEVVQAVRACGDVFADLGAHVTNIPFLEAAEATPRGVVAAEAYAIHRERIETHLDQYDPIVAPRILQGKEIRAFEYFDATRAWASLRARVQYALREVDALLVPTTMIPALPVSEVDASLEVYHERNLQYLRNTSIGNILNLCGLSVPCGFTSQGLPIGLMIYGNPFHEDMILRIGYAFQQVTDWHRRTPLNHQNCQRMPNEWGPPSESIR